MESVDLGGVEVVVVGYEVWGFCLEGGVEMMMGRDGEWKTREWMKEMMIWKIEERGKGIKRPGNGSTSYSIVQCRAFLETRGRRPFFGSQFTHTLGHRLYNSTL